VRCFDGSASGVIYLGLKKFRRDKSPTVPWIPNIGDQISLGAKHPRYSYHGVLGLARKSIMVRSLNMLVYLLTRFPTQYLSSFIAPSSHTFIQPLPSYPPPFNNTRMALNVITLPAEILIEILKHLFNFPDRTYRTVVMESMDAKELLEESIFKLLGTSKRLYQTAEEVFYSQTTLILRGTSIHTSFYLPNLCVRNWINRIELRVKIPAPSRVRSLKSQLCECWADNYIACPHYGWSLLQNFAEVHCSFLKLKHIHVVCETSLQMHPQRFQRLHSELEELDAIRIPTQALTIKVWCVDLEGSKGEEQRAALEEILPRKITSS
jgi:hypothetical protein